jgi:SAM-dependent methyltransferase
LSANESPEGALEDVQEDAWNELTEWWLDEVDEPAYAEEVVPLFFSVLDTPPGSVVLDLGCGEGRVAAEVVQSGVSVIGIDVNRSLAAIAIERIPAAVGRLPDMAFVRSAAVNGAYVVLAFEHIHDMEALFDEAFRVVRSGGTFTIVLNHPVYTAPNSGPILDPTDGELFWRFGDYLSPGSTCEPAGDGDVEFVHRPVGMVLTAAADSGWMLEVVREQGVGTAAAARDSLLAKHHEIPHLMAVRWRKP